MSSLGKIKGNQLRALRKARELTQSDIAKACNVDDRTVRKWESGETPLPDDAIERISSKFKVLPAFFYDVNFPITDSPLMSLTRAADVLRALEMVSHERRQMALAILFDDASLAPELPGLGDALKKLVQGLPHVKLG